VVFINDILVYSYSQEDKKNRLRIILNILREKQLGVTKLVTIIHFDLAHLVCQIRMPKARQVVQATKPFFYNLK